MHSAMAYISG